jgi:MFS family permease
LPWAPWQLWIACVLYGVYYGATEGVARAYVADVVDDKYRATAYGFYQAAVAVAILPASAGEGLLWDAMGPALPFAVGAVLALCAAMLLAVSGRQRS